MDDHSPYVKASFYTSFFEPSKKKKLLQFTGLPVSPINHTFLQTPLWLTKPTLPSTPKSEKKPSKKQSNSGTLKQSIYVLPKSPSNVSIYLQVPQFRSLSFFLCSGHVSPLVENWLCNPMNNLKKAASVPLSQGHDPHHNSSSLLNILPSVPNTEPQRSSLSVAKRDYSMVRGSNLSSVTVHIQEHIMKFEYAHVPSSFTIVCVTYHLGHVSLSVYQIESLNILLSSHALNSFLIRCQLQPKHPVTIHQFELYRHHRLPLLMICDFEYNSRDHLADVQIDSSLLVMDMYHNTVRRPSILHIEEVSMDTTQSSIQHCIEEGEHQMVHKEDMPTADFVHYEELYQEDDDDDDTEFGFYSSSEEFSLIDEDDRDQDPQNDVHENAYERAQSALLRLAQDTLQYIHSSSQGALTEGLNNLEHKLYDYCRNRASTA